MHGQLGPNHSASLRREAGAQRGEAIIAQELRRLGWNQGESSRRAKTDSEKVGLAAKLREETTMTLGQIAQRLTMGTRDTLSAKLQQRKCLNERAK
jgi:hypothetical protein